MGLHDYLGRLKVVAADKSEKKNVFKITKEVLHSAMTSKELPIHYASKFLYRKESGNYDAYLTPKEEVQVRFSKNLHSIAFHTLLKNKLSSALYFEQCGLNVPAMPLYNVERMFFNDSGCHEIDTLEKLKKIIENTFATHQLKGLFIKELAESGGTGCYLLKRNNWEQKLEEISSKLLDKSFIYQEQIDQHPQLAAVNPSSLNTIRFETYIDTKEKAHIVSSYIRFGIGKSIVDNAGAGGFIVAIDPESGRLKGKGYQKLKANGGAAVFNEHPDTKHHLDGLELPFYDEACKLILQAVDCVPERYIGWDIAITPNGPVIIEGNAAPHIMLGDITYGGYKKHPLYPEILEEAFKTGIHTDRIMYFKNL